jgi:hypothetical protein
MCELRTNNTRKEAVTHFAFAETEAREIEIEAAFWVNHTLPAFPRQLEPIAC